MPIYPVQDFISHVKPGTRLMALDVGAKTIGLATALWGAELTMPLRTLKRIKFTQDAEALKIAIRQYDVSALVIGYPLQLDGTEGRRCQSVRDFTTELENVFKKAGLDMPMTYWDERFTTIQADEVIHSPVNNLRTKRDQIIDAVAAQQILQDFVETNTEYSG